MLPCCAWPQNLSRSTPPSAEGGIRSIVPEVDEDVHTIFGLQGRVQGRHAMAKCPAKNCHVNRGKLHKILT